jgi:hypothetical protein
MGPNAVDAQPQYLRIELFELLHLVDEASMFVGADRAPIEWVEHENDALVAAKIA